MYTGIWLTSLRDLEEMMAERGLSVDHSTVHRQFTLPNGRHRDMTAPRAPRRASHAEEADASKALEDQDINFDGKVAGGAPRKTFAQAAWQIVVPDV